MLGSRGSALVFATLALALACSSERPSAAVDDPSVAVEQPEPEPEEQPMRVLVTGFNDWRELGEPPNVWRCRDNPSCRLLLGEAHDARPTTLAGPLVARLEAAAPDVEWTFATMPVTWGAFAEVPSDVDVIVNLGLGVYDRVDALQLEAGAYNFRRGVDAAGGEQSGPIDEAAEPVLAPAPTSPIPARIAALAGRRIAGYEVVVAEAREDNSYLCNETHYHALAALGRGQGRLREVYFLHIPYAEGEDYEKLAAGVAGVILGLLER